MQKLSARASHVLYSQAEAMQKLSARASHVLYSQAEARQKLNAHASLAHCVCAQHVAGVLTPAG
eukprot:365955-Chlamydomonas_euryale.AAC.1